MTEIPAFHVVGDAFCDLFSFLEGDWPEKGGDAKLSHPIETLAGGSSINTTTHLNALSRYFGDPQNPPTLVLHTILNPGDAHGQMLLSHAQRQGFPLVNCKQPDDAAATGHCVAIVSGQERSFLSYRGCVDHFQASHLNVRQIIDSESPVVHLHLAGYFNLSGFQHGLVEERIRYIQKCRSENGKATVVSLVPQHDATKQWDGGIDDLTANCLDFLIMNDLEAMQIMKLGQKRKNMITTDAQEGDDAILECAKYFGQISSHTCIVLTRGPLGAVALRAGKIVVQRSTVTVKPIDPTGAGDSFAAGFLHGLWDWKRRQQESLPAQGRYEWPTEALQRALLWGCAMGSSSVLVRGASIPSSKEDIQTCFAQIQNLVE